MKKLLAIALLSLAGCDAAMQAAEDQVRAEVQQRADDVTNTARNELSTRVEEVTGADSNTVNGFLDGEVTSDVENIAAGTVSNAANTIDSRVTGQ